MKGQVNMDTKTRTTDISKARQFLAHEAHDYKIQSVDRDIHWLRSEMVDGEVVNYFVCTFDYGLYYAR